MLINHVCLMLATPTVPDVSRTLKVSEIILKNRLATALTYAGVSILDLNESKERRKKYELNQVCPTREP